MAKRSDKKDVIPLNMAWDPNKTVVVKTGLRPIDSLLDGGIELGSKTMLLGESGVGKSSIAIQMCTELCAQGYKSIYIDTENSVSQQMVRSIGLENYINNCDEGSGGVFIHKVSSYQEVEDIIDQYLNSNQIKISVIFIDSFAGLISNCYTNIGDKHQSVVNSNTNFESRPATIFMTKYTALASKNKVAFIYTNQYRTKLDFKNNQSSSKEYGSKAIRYNMDTLIKVSQHYNSKDEVNLDFDNAVKLELKIVKSNKLNPNTATCCYLEYGKGINERMSLIDDLIKNNIIHKNGSYYAITIKDEEYKFQGINKMYDFISKKYDEIKKQFELEVQEEVFIIEKTLGGIDSDYEEDYE